MWVLAIRHLSLYVMSRNGEMGKWSSRWHVEDKRQSKAALRSELSHPSTFVIGARPLCMNLAGTQRHFVNGMSSFTKFTKQVRK